MRRQRLIITNNSPAVLGFALACLAALLANQFTGGKANKLLFMTYHSSLKNVLTYVRFFTHVLGHSSWTHFIGNMSYILLLGPALEENTDHRRSSKSLVLQRWWPGWWTGSFSRTWPCAEQAVSYSPSFFWFRLQMSDPVRFPWRLFWLR